MATWLQPSLRAGFDANSRVFIADTVAERPATDSGHPEWGFGGPSAEHELEMWCGVLVSGWEAAWEDEIFAGVDSGRGVNGKERGKLMTREGRV